MNTDQEIIYTNQVQARLEQIIARMRPASVHVVTDANVAPIIAGLLPDAPRTVIEPGDSCKTLAAAEQVWLGLVEAGATRSSVVVNIGGGMVTDLGGFAASTFKRGVPFINVPTTLLGAVDAAVGGKTGVNLGGLKNEIGVFNEAQAVVISTAFFASLSRRELLSGFAEMIKHGLLDGPELLADTLGHRLTDLEALLPLLQRSVEVKRRVVEADPTEQGLRRALNLGHTAGHAFESLALRSGSPVPHGYAVAWGIVVELILSRMLAGFQSYMLHIIAAFIKENYGTPQITCDDYPALLELMSHDKKNSAPGLINFTLMKAPGQPLPGQVVDSDTIVAALDIFRDIMQ